MRGGRKTRGRAGNSEEEFGLFIKWDFFFLLLVPGVKV